LEKAGNILNNLLNNLLEKKQNKEGTVYHHFFNNWEQIVGKKLYGHTKVMDIQNNNLLVAVDHPGWLQILKLKERYILKKMNNMFPQLNVRSIKIRVREDCFKIKQEIKKKNLDTVKKTEKIDVSIEDVKKFDKIEDEQLKNTLKRLYMSLIKRGEES
jgi:hypothetical protein